MNGAIVHTWEGTVPGREVKGLEVLGGALAYYDELAKEGRIHGYSTFVKAGGSPNGMIVITGDIEELRAIELEENYMRILGEASLVARDFRTQMMGGGGGDDIAEGITSYMETLTRLGIS